MFLKKAIFTPIIFTKFLIFYILFLTNFKSSYCMGFYDNTGADQEEHELDILDGNSSASSTNSIGAVNGTQDIEQLSQEYLQNPAGGAPDFPKSLRKPNTDSSVTAVHLAAQYNCANWLAANCVNKNPQDISNFLNVRDSDLNLPMHYAACNLKLEAARCLLKHNAHFIFLNKYHESVICIALKYGPNKRPNAKKLCIDFLNLILESCADNFTRGFLINTFDKSGNESEDEYNWNALFWAIKYWDKEIFELLFKFYESSDSSYFTKQRLYSLAKSLGKDDIANLILNHRVTVGKAWPYGDDEDDCVII